MSEIHASERQLERFRVGRKFFATRAEAEQEARHWGFRSRNPSGFYYELNGERWSKRTTPTILAKYFQEVILPTKIIPKYRARHPDTELDSEMVNVHFKKGGIEWDHFLNTVGYQPNEIRWLRSRIADLIAFDTTRLATGEKFELVPGVGLVPTQ
tara:strand:+ start:873 stop:1337 length:465 start_codon:yes stop_codon:yes gene_type:complete